jgi:putative membrane protein
MRFLCFLFLVAFAGAVILFALENQQAITLTFYNWTLTSTVATVIGASFVLGMFSGWSIVGMLRRSLYRVTEEPVRDRAGAYR